MSESETSSEGAGKRTRLILAALPLAIFLGLALIFWTQLNSGRDISEIPSALIGTRAPFRDLEPLVGATKDGAPVPALTAEAVKGKLTLVNFWASWCVPCVAEHPQLMRLAREGIPVLGINYKDKRADALAFPARRGDPFTRLGVDEPGRVAIDWGVYGVPETYFVDRQGIIRWRWAGPVTPEVVEQDLRPLLRRYA